MSRKCKFDQEWKEALSWMHPNDARKVREIIINYQETGIMPSTIETKFEIILLLVQPTIDRRRRAAAKARIRRQQQKEQGKGQKTSNRQPHQSASKPTPATEQGQNQDVPRQACQQTLAHIQSPIVRQAMKHKHKQQPRKQRTKRVLFTFKLTKNNSAKHY